MLVLVLGVVLVLVFVLVPVLVLVPVPVAVAAGCCWGALVLVLCCAGWLCGCCGVGCVAAVPRTVAEQLWPQPAAAVEGRLGL